MSVSPTVEVYHLYAGPQPAHTCEPLFLADCVCCALTLTLCVQVTFEDVDAMMARCWRCDVCRRTCGRQQPWP